MDLNDSSAPSSSGATVPGSNSIRSSASISEYYIFLPKDLPEGQEHKKILYFHPSSIPVEDQTKYIGLSEAFVNFTGKFSETGCEAVHYEKHTSAFFQPEDQFWIVMTVNNPTTTKVRDGKTVVEFKNDLDDIALQNVVKQAYKTFKLFYGSFRHIIHKYSEDVLRQKLDLFFSQYLASLKFDQVDLFNTLEGIHFLPVDKNVYLRIQCLINLTENTFPKIHYSSFLYRDHLVWSGLELDDMRVLYKYLIGYLNPHLSDSQAAPSLIKINKVQKGFITGSDTTQDVEVPLVYVGQKDESYNLIIYKMQESTCIFLVDTSSSSDSSFYKNLGSFIAHQLEFLAPILEDHYLKKHSFDDQYRYVYFNHMNFALKTSIKEKGAAIPRDTMKMLNDIHADFEKTPENLSEVLIRTQNDKWVVGRRSDQREFFVIFDHKNSLLIEINEEVKKLSSTYFNNIFID